MGVKAHLFSLSIIQLNKLLSTLKPAVSQFYASNRQQYYASKWQRTLKRASPRRKGTIRASLSATTVESQSIFPTVSEDNAPTDSIRGRVQGPPQNTDPRYRRCAILSSKTVNFRRALVGNEFRVSQEANARIGSIDRRINRLMPRNGKPGTKSATSELLTR